MTCDSNQWVSLSHSLTRVSTCTHTHTQRDDELINGNQLITQWKTGVKLGFPQECESHITDVLQYWKICARWGFLYADGRDESFESWNLPATFVTLREQRSGISWQYSDSQWNMGASLWTLNQALVHGMSSQRFTGEKKFKNTCLGMTTHGYSFLGCRWCY